MITRVKPMGWWPREKPMPWHLDGVDANLVKAIDGDGGGYYRPSEALTIGGAGLGADPLSRLRMFGPCGLRSYDARMCWRLEFIAPPLLMLVDTTKDEYHTIAPLPGTRTVWLNVNTPGYKIPEPGERIRLVNTEHVASFDLIVQIQGGGNVIVLETGWPYATWAECTFTGTPGSEWIISAHRCRP